MSNKKSALCNNIDELRLFLHLLGEDLAHKDTGLDDLGVGNGIIDVDTLPACFQDALVPHDREVLGNICLGHAEYLNELCNGLFTLFQGVQDFQPLGACKGLAYFGLQFKKSLVLFHTCIFY